MLGITAALIGLMFVAVAVALIIALTQTVHRTLSVPGCVPVYVYPVGTQTYCPAPTP